MKGLVYIIIFIFSMSTSTQQLKTDGTTSLIEASSSVALQGEDGQTPSGEGE